MAAITPLSHLWERGWGRGYEYRRRAGGEDNGINICLFILLPKN
jgi:hypothetical protein